MQTLRHRLPGPRTALIPCAAASRRSFSRDRQFLSYLPENQGGLFPVGVALFHPSDQVRQSTAALFDRIAKFKVPWQGLRARPAEKETGRSRPLCWRCGRSVGTVAPPQAGSGFITNMNHFLRLAYDAVRHA